MPDSILRGGDAIAAALGLPRRSVYHHAAAGRLPTFKIGHTLCAKRSSVAAWLERCDAAPAGALPPPAPAGEARAAA